MLSQPNFATRILVSFQKKVYNYVELSIPGKSTVVYSSILKEVKMQN